MTKIKQNTRYRKTAIIVCMVSLCSLCSTGWSAKIVYPWRATTAIVKTNETFEVWFVADSGQNLNSVQLKSTYKTATAVVTSTNTATWTYDQMSGNTCNRKYTVKVPYGTPADRYDLVLKTSTGDITSLAAVKVINEYKSSYYVVHTTDNHLWQAGYDPTNTAREVAAVIEMANILDPEMIINTGDAYYPNANSATVDTQRIVDMMNGWVVGSEIKGLNDAYAAIFMVPGNHDTTLKSYELEPDLATPARDWNKRFGLQSHNFKYGNGRFMGVNNAWCPDTGGSSSTYDWQLNAAKSWISSVGAGNFRVTYAHVPQESVPPVYSALNSVGAAPKLMLAGHTHNPDYNPMRVNGTDAYIVYVGDTFRDLNGMGPFNLFKVDATAGTFAAVGNTKAVNQALEVKANYSSGKLKLAYSSANNGTVTNNTATITNKFGFAITGARVRFVMKRGTYTVNTGTIKQQFDGTLSGANVTVVDVSADVNANGTKTINISGNSISQVTVPNVMNMTESSAKSSITGAGLTVSGVSSNYHATVAAGIIYSQTPGGGTLVAPGSSVALAVSKGPSNQPPYFTSNPFSLADATTGAAYSQSFSAQAVDPEGGTKAFSKVSGPVWLSVTSAGNAQGTPATVDAGTNSFLVKVTDVGGLSATVTMKINVIAAQPALPAVGSIITLKAVNGKYVSATYSTNNTLIANKTTVSNYERFKVVNATNSIALQCMGNSKFVSIDAANGSKPMVANRTSIGSYEKYQLVQSGSQIAIRSDRNTNYVSAVSNGVAPLQASQTYVGAYEKFTWKVE